MGGKARRGQVRRPRTPDTLKTTAEDARRTDRAWHRPLRRAAWLALAGTKMATLAYTTEAVLRPHQRKYHGKAMRIRSLGYLGGLALVPAAWWVLERGDRYPVAADLAVTVPLLIDAAGNSLGIYDEARLDDVVHGFNAAVLSSLFGAVVSSRMDSRAAAAGTTVAFGVAGEIAFDAMEYVAEAIGFRGLGLSRDDTLADIAAATVGALVAGLFTWARWKPRRDAPLVGLPAATLRGTASRRFRRSQVTREASR